MLRLSRLPLITARKRNLTKFFKSGDSPPENLPEEFQEDFKNCDPEIASQALRDNVVWSIPKPASGKSDGPMIESNAISQKLSCQSLLEPELTPLYDFYESARNPEWESGSDSDFYESERDPGTWTKQVEMLELHPDIWCAQVDQNVISRALEWQNSYRTVDMSFEQSRLEVGRKRYSKPWQGSGEGWERCKEQGSKSLARVFLVARSQIVMYYTGM